MYMSMRRTGLSLSLSYVVMGLILLTVAATVILFATGNIQDVGGIVDSQLGQSETSLAENSCLRQKSQVCDDQGSSCGASCWLSRAEYDGETCDTYLDASEVTGCP